MSFESSKGTLYLNLMRNHVAFIKNTCCHQPPLIVTRFVEIYDYIRVSLIGRIFLLISAQAKYYLKVESLCNI